MTRAPARLLSVFITGLVAALPLVATIAIVGWLLRIVWGWVGPQSAVGQLLVQLGLAVAGTAVIGYLLGIALLIGLLMLLGVLVRTRLRPVMASAVTAVLGRIPIVRNVYDLAQKMVGLFAQRDTEGMTSMSAVWCFFGGPDPAQPHAAVLALLSTPEPVWIDGHPYLGVIVPTAPVPIGGGLLFLPQAWVQPAEVGMEALTSIYVSMGLTAAQHLRARPGASGDVTVTS